MALAQDSSIMMGCCKLPLPNKNPQTKLLFNLSTLILAAFLHHALCFPNSLIKDDTHGWNPIWESDGFLEVGGYGFVGFGTARLERSGEEWTLADATHPVGGAYLRERVFSLLDIKGQYILKSDWFLGTSDAQSYGMIMAWRSNPNCIADRIAAENPIFSAAPFCDGMILAAWTEKGRPSGFHTFIGGKKVGFDEFQTFDDARNFYSKWFTITVKISETSDGNGRIAWSLPSGQLIGNEQVFTIDDYTDYGATERLTFGGLVKDTLTGAGKISFRNVIVSEVESVPPAESTKLFNEALQQQHKRALSMPPLDSDQEVQQTKKSVPEKNEEMPSLQSKDPPSSFSVIPMIMILAGLALVVVGSVGMYSIWERRNGYIEMGGQEDLFSL